MGASKEAPLIKLSWRFTMVTKDKTLAQIVMENPASARVLRRLRLDFCCGGEQTLEKACADRGIDPEVVEREVENAAKSNEGDRTNWIERPIPELVQHILDRYHAPLRTEISDLVDLALKVEQVHQDKPERPEGLADVLGDAREAIESHLEKEEKILFPLIVSGGGQMAYMPIKVMMMEHGDHANNLRRIREITKDFTLPDYACASWRELYRALEELEMDLMYHIHLENNILFPRVLGV
jgi:regulator of cell morphogenesis and NO signaling